MTQEHPIRPPHELVEEWFTEQRGLSEASRQHIATQAARWGADQELEACCEILRGEFNYHHLVEPLRAVRRPKPPSLKEQALTQLDSLHADLKTHGLGTNTDTIRRALEQLND